MKKKHSPPFFIPDILPPAAVDFSNGDQVVPELFLKRVAYFEEIPGFEKFLPFSVT